MDIKNRIFKVVVKLNSNKNELKGFDASRKAYIITIREKAEDNKANIELVKFLSKMLGKRVRIKNGLRSREKTIEA